MKSILPYLDRMGLHDKLFDSALAFAFFVMLHWALVRIFRQFPHEKQNKFFWRKAATYFSVSVLIILLGFVWLPGFHSLSTFIGLLSAGLAIALKDPITNIAGWLFILVRKPFETGDRVQVGNHAGDVIDIDIFQFTLLESGTTGVSKDIRTGRLIKISNNAVFTEPQINYTAGWFEYIWNTIEVCVTFESNWKKAMIILEEIVTAEGEDASRKAKENMAKASERYLVLDMGLGPRVLAAIGNNGVVLTAVYLCDPRSRRFSSSKVSEQLLEKYSEEDDIAFAYNTERSFSTATKGNPATKVGVARTGSGSKEPH